MAKGKKGQSEKTERRLNVRHDRLIHNAKENYQEKQKLVFDEKTLNIDLLDTYVPNKKMILDLKELSFSFTNKKSFITSTLLYKDQSIYP